MLIGVDKIIRAEHCFLKYILDRFRATLKDGGEQSHNNSRVQKPRE